MPWYLVPPRKGKTPHWAVRGKYLGIKLDGRSTGTGDGRAARRILKLWREQAERGEFAQAVETITGPELFLSAAKAYMQAGGERKYIMDICEKWPTKIAADIDQIAIDSLAAELYPNATAATRNRQVYTPVSAILKHVGIEKKIKRPKGWRGQKSTRWLEREQAFAAFAAGDKIDLEFGLFLRTLCYTGMRLSECLGVKLSDLNLEKQTIYLPETKNGESRLVYLPPRLVVALANHPRGLDRKGRLFRFHAGGRLRDMWNEAKAAAGIVMPRRQGGFHLFCHTWGTWMRRYGGLDTYDLLDTDRWKDPASANRYAHMEIGEMARRADMLPTEASNMVERGNKKEIA